MGWSSLSASAERSDGVVAIGPIAFPPVAIVTGSLLPPLSRIAKYHTPNATTATTATTAPGRIRRPPPTAAPWASGPREGSLDRRLNISGTRIGWFQREGVSRPGV